MVKNLNAEHSGKPDMPRPLNQTEVDLLALLFDGHTKREAAKSLQINVPETNNHFRNLRSKMIKAELLPLGSVNYSVENVVLAAWASGLVLEDES